jgi:Ca2+-binding RTX toxin-like protein
VATIIGTAGADTITDAMNTAGGAFATAGADSITGAAGNDSLAGAGGNDSLDGGANNDSLSGGSGNDVLKGEAGDDFLSDEITTPGNNGADTLDGGEGNDFFSVGDGADSINGGTGNDTVSYFGSVGVTVNLATGSAVDGDGNADSLVGIEAVWGTGEADSIVGSTASNYLDGSGGADTIRGGEGNDTIRGGAGVDSLNGEGGFGDVLDYSNATSGVVVNLGTGVTGNDGLGGADSIAGFERLYGSVHGDTLIGGAGVETFYAFGGNDSVTGGGGAADWLVYNTVGIALPPGASAAQGINANLATNIIADANGGNDTIAGIAVIVATGFADTMRGGAGAETLFGGEGNDIFVGSAGNDSLAGEGGTNDFLDYSNAAGAVHVNLAGPFTATQDGFTDTISGFERYAGTGGADTFAGSSVSEFFLPFGGADTINGSGGFDWVIYDAGRGLAAGPTQGINADLAAFTIIDGNGGTDGVVQVEGVKGTGFGDTIIGDGQANRFMGKGGNDSLDGGTGNDTLDYTEAAAGINVNLLTGVVSNDGEGGADSIAGFEAAFGGTGDDVITGGDGNDTLYGGAGTGADTLVGGAGADSLIGDQGADSLVGDAGNDTLLGGLGNDTLVGGEGADYMRPNEGADSVIGGGGGVSDTVSYFTDTGPIVAILTTAGPDGHDGTILAGGLTDTVQGIEAVEGTSGADRFEVQAVNTTTGAQFYGFQGADTMIGTADRNLSVQVLYNVSGITGGVNVDLGTGDVLNDGFGFADKLVNIGFVQGTSLADTLIGSDVNDRFRARGGNDIVEGRGGTGDILDYAQANAGGGNGIVANLVTGIVQDGDGGADTVSGFEDIRGTRGADSILGSATNETFYLFNGADTVDGGGGNDRISYSILLSGNVATPVAPQGAQVNLAAGTAVDPWGDADRLFNIDRATGSQYADTLIGNAGQNRFNGRAGNDSLDGGLGGDYAEYTSTSTGVEVNLTAGRAYSDGEGGADTLSSIEHVIGGTGADTLTGIAQRGRSASDLRGGAGADLLIGIAGEYVRADYSDQTAAMNIDLGAGTVTDSSGATDTLVNIRGVTMFGDFADTLKGTAENDLFFGGDGADSINGGGGFDLVSHSGLDVGGIWVDLVAGQATDSGAAADAMVGIEGVLLSFGDDTVLGDGGDNLVAPGAGADSINAGLGEDTVSYAHGFSPDGVEYTANQAGDRLPVQGVVLDLAAGTATDYAGDADTLIGFEHAIGSTVGDTLRGSNIGNRIWGAEGNDLIEGREGADALHGEWGNDSLHGGLGNDTAAGGTGDDLIDDAANLADFVVNGSFELFGNATAFESGRYYEAGVLNGWSFTGAAVVQPVVYGGAIAAASDGQFFLDMDTNLETLVVSQTIAGLTSGESYTLSLDVASYSGAASGVFVSFGGVALGLAANVSGIWQTASYVITGGMGDGSNTLRLTDEAIGIAVDKVRITGPGPADGADSLAGGEGNDTILARLGNDTLLGQAGNDSLDGGLGTDTAVFAGNVADFLRTDLGGGVWTVVDQRGGAPEGADTVSGMELLQFADTVIGIGGGPTPNADTLAGTAGADTIDALAGADSVSGLAGNDSLMGSADNDTLDGGADNDTLDGGPGADSMNGGAGNDSYVLDVPGDGILDAAGVDSVLAYITYTLGATLENLTLAGAATVNGTGNGLDNVITGTGLANRLGGVGGADTLIGLGDNDTLEGGAAIDRLEGGDGNDLYVIGDAGDVVIETPTGGLDTVLATVELTLADFVEVLTLAGSAGAIGGFGSGQNNQLNGNNSANHLRGMGGNDSLSGAGGADTLEGGLGNDDYVVDATDLVVEAPGQGTDILRIGQTTTLSGGLANIEYLVLTGGAAVNGTGNNVSNNITGNSAGNHLIGLGGNDTLSGAGGADTLEGGANRDNLLGGDGADLLIGGVLNDTLTGSAGNDIFRFNLASEFGDRINDFTKNQDKLEIAGAALGGALPLGVLGAANFANGAPTAALPQFVYTKATGMLDFDADGTGAGAAVNVAYLANKVSLVAADVIII